MDLWLRPARIALLALALVPAALTAQPADGVPPVTIGVVRADGLIVPFANWDGKRWQNTWPVPDKKSDTPITTADIPKRWWGKEGPVEDWHVWRVDGSRAQALVRRPTWYLAHCQQGTGLATNLEVRQPVPPPVVQPYPKLGLAASTPVRFLPIAVLGPDSPVWKALAGTIEARVTAEEDRLTKLALMGGWKHPNEPEERGRTRVEIQALYRAPVGEGRFLYFYEAVKRYTFKEVVLRADRASKREPPRRPDDCSVLTFANGWFTAGNTDTRLEVPDPNVRLVSCDFAEADVMLPLGYVPGGQGPTWVVQMSGWGREQFALLRWDAAAATVRALFTVHGGECPRVR